MAYTTKWRNDTGWHWINQTLNVAYSRLDSQPFRSRANLPPPRANRPVGCWPIHYLEPSLPGAKWPGYFRSQEYSLPGTFVYDTDLLYWARMCSWFTRLVDLLLQKRHFRVHMGSDVSSWRFQRNDLPQGSVLASVLFNLYTNDLLIAANSYMRMTWILPPSPSISAN